MHLYCGTSLSKAEARTLVPSEWVVHPPVRRGDLPRLAEEVPTPGLALLIDGLFFMSESVSLTEIRDLIEKGWRVYGSSSMGALRAVEAAPLGMVGVGAVFRWLRAYRIEDDDEVAQAVMPGTFESQSLAMVDIRALLSRLQRAGWLAPADRKEIADKVKARYFPERSLALVRALLAETAYRGPKEIPKSLLKTLPKHQDALRLIDRVRGEYVG